MKKIFLLLWVLFTFNLFGQNVLTITNETATSYKFNGTVTGDVRVATEASDNTVKIYNFTRRASYSYTTKSGFSDFSINGVSPIDVEDAVRKINDVTNLIATKYEVPVPVNQTNVAYTLGGDINSSKVYFIDGVVDLTGVDIEVPAGGLSLAGYTFDTSKLVCSDSNYTMFKSPVGGSGNLLAVDLSVEVTGTNSKVFDLVSVTGGEALELNRVNFNNCTSLGELTNYKQYLEDGTGRFGGTPELTFSGTNNGARITTSIVRGIEDITSLFKAGTGLTFSGRFITDINCDLNTNGALFDFSEVNFINDESLIIKGAFVTRNGVIDASDSTIHPNIDHTNVKSLWSDNTGVPNTTKYIKSVCTAEIETIISVIDTYYPLLGTATIERQSHFDMPSNGEFRLLSGNGTYQISGDLVVKGSQGDEINIRITKSTDNGVTFPTVINHIKRIVNNLAGGRDVAFFPLNFISDLKKNDRIRIEVENKSGTGNVTKELDSYFIVTKI